MVKKILVYGTVALIGAFLGALANKKGRELGEAGSEASDSEEQS